MKTLACPWCNTRNFVIPVEEHKINAHTCHNCGMTFDYKRDNANAYVTIRHGIDTSVYMDLHDDNPMSAFGTYLRSMTKGYYISKYPASLPGIKKIIENNPATVILWEDGTKTMAKCQDDDEFDFEKGAMICSLKKLIGNKATNELLKRMENQPKKSKSCKDCQFDKVAFTNFPCDRCREKDGLRTEFMPKLCQSCKHLEETYEDGPCYKCLGVYRKNRLHPNWEPEE